MSDKSKNSIFESFTKGLYTAGICLLILCSGDMTENKLIGLMMAYGFILVGLLVFVTLLYQNGKMSLNSSSMMSIGPLIMFMLIIVMFISAISPNFDKISKGHVSSSFSNMISLQNMLMVLILIVTSMSTNSEEFKKSGSISEQFGAGLWFMNVLSGVILATIYIILFVYPTDGFVSMSDL